MTTNNKLKTTLLYLLIFLIGILSAILLYFFQNFHNVNYYLPGVHIADFSVEGYTEEEAIQELSDKIDYYLDMPIHFFYNDYSYMTKLGDICDTPLIKEIVADTWQQEQNRGIYSKAINIDGSKLINYPIKIGYNQEAIDNMVNFWNSNIAVPYVNASLEVDKIKGLVVTPSKLGREVDAATTLAGLPQEIILKNEVNELKLPIIMQEIKPFITENDLHNMGELATYTTWYNMAEVDRSHNVKISSDSINGTIIAPGEVFSFNNVVGKRTYATGYRDAAVIVGGLFEPGLGGGICQVSSTLYNTALLAGMDIVERHNHALAVAYIPLGQDATVAYGLQDFRFKNNTNYPIYIRALASGGKLTITIYGDMNYKQRIEVGHVVDKVIDYTEVRKVEDNLLEGEEKIETNGMPGYVVRSFRTFYDQEGNKVKTENLATDRYLPLNKVVKIGPKKEVEDELPIIDNNLVEELPLELEFHDN